MNIAITTWHSGPNAGTFFQLYGLYSYLTDRGHHVEVINYNHVNNDFISRGFFYFLSQPFALLRRKIKRRKEAGQYVTINTFFADQLKTRDERFAEMYKNIVFTGTVATDEDFAQLNERFDVFIVGSDQVWNPSMLNRRYFLDYVEPGKIKAAYCPSMGSGTVLKYQRKVFQQYVSSFNYVATRELRLKEILTPLLPIPVEHLLDPSMLYSREKYLEMAHLPEQFKPGKYLLCYFLPRNDFQARQAYEFAQEKGLELVIMALNPYSYFVKDAAIYAAAGPKEFLGLIANAAVVFTSSFHCTIFSILFHRDLYVFEQSSSSKTADINQRYIEQLETYGITHRYIRYGESLSPAHQKGIDYDKVEKIFQERLQKSFQFLNQFC